MARDREVLDSFKAAALSVTTLYKSSQRASKTAYNEGYAACLQDLLNFVQAGVSSEGRMPEIGGHDGSGALGLELHNFGVDGDGMTIGRVMDWIENRLETLRSEEDDCEADEDDKRGKPRPEEKKPATSGRPIRATTKSSLASSDTDGGDQVRPAVVPPLPGVGPRQQRPATPLSSVSPPWTRSETTQTLQTGTSSTRLRAKAERQLRQSLMAPLQSPSFALPTDSSQHTPTPNTHNFLPATNGFPQTEFAPLYPENTQAILGSKRRHATMVSEITNTSMTNGPTTLPNDSPSNTNRSCIPMSGKRRNRGGPQQNPSRSATNAEVSDSMDVEDSEPARKRITRR